MANRVPLIVDTSTLNIKELPAGDSLDLTNSGIVNAGVITASSFSGNISGTPTLGTGVTITSSGINVTGVITASNGFSGDLTGDVTGDVTGAATQVTLADESSDTTCFPIFATGATGNLAPKTGTNLTFNSSTGDLTVGGNVSVGGTLTYQDVRNVDSLGIVTARNGLRVTAGGINVTAGISTFGGVVDINNNVTISGTLDVDGQTDLDVLNVAETATFSALVDVNNRIDIVGGANVDQVNVTGVSTYAGTAKFDGTIDANGLIDADGGANIVGGLTVDQVNVSGVSTYGGNVDINANVDVSGTSTLNDDVTFTGANYNVTWDKSKSAVIFNDNAQLNFGTDEDGDIYHDDANMIINNAKGKLMVRSSSVNIAGTSNEKHIVSNTGLGVTVYYNNSERVQTTSDGTDFGGTGAIGITKGTTGQRPGSPAAGDFRYNTTTDKFEGYTTKWGAIGGGSEEVDNIVSQTTATGVGTMSAAENRAASIRALIQQGTNYQVGRYLMIHDNSTVTVVEESAVSTGGSMLGSFDGVISGSNAVLRVTMVSAASTAVVTTLIDKITI